MTGVPVSSWTFIRPCVTASQMYSKCIVEPLIKQPIAIAEVKGPVDAPEAGVGVMEAPPETASLLRRFTRFVVDAFSREGAELDD